MPRNIRKFSPSVSRKLKHYVYLYSHPDTGEIFYVGKGRGNRVFSHLEEGEKDSKKTEYLKELKKLNKEPTIEILVHGLESERAAYNVESAVIDLLGVDSLTNAHGGRRSVRFGRMSVEQIVSVYSEEMADITEAVVLIRPATRFRFSLSEIELYDYTRSWWKIDKARAENAKYAICVYEGIIQEVYSIKGWYGSGETFFYRKEKPDEGRYEFVGNVAPEDIRKKYRYKSVNHLFKKGNLNPIMYVNC